MSSPSSWAHESAILTSSRAYPPAPRARDILGQTAPCARCSYHVATGSASRSPWLPWPSEPFTLRPTSSSRRGATSARLESRADAEAPLILASPPGINCRTASTRRLSFPHSLRCAPCSPLCVACVCCLLAAAVLYPTCVRGVCYEVDENHWGLLCSVAEQQHCQFAHVPILRVCVCSLTWRGVLLLFEILVH
ncbi:hypothetical protein ACQJBY_029882 [Aegilops geniculata]